jgi:hypothetical protein
MYDDRPRVIRAIKTCLSDSYEHFNDAMDSLDSIGMGSMGAGMTPLVGGYAMSDNKDKYRSALVKLDSGRKSLEPLAKRIRDGRVDQSYFESERAMVLLKDIIEYDYDILIEFLAERKGRESVWYRLRELGEKVKQVFEMVSKE